MLEATERGVVEWIRHDKLSMLLENKDREVSTYLTSQKTPIGTDSETIVLNPG